MKRVLVIAAHPDDEVLGCGGLMAKYRPRGVEFHVLFVAEGSSCRYADPAGADSVAAIAQRNALAVQALALLDVHSFEFHNLPCGRLDQVPVIEINKIIEAAIAGFQPDTVLTHAAHDANNDHRILYNATIMATRPGGRNHVARVLSFEVLSSSEWAFAQTFAPNYFETLDAAQVERKWQALAAYESEVRSYPFPRSREGVLALAMNRGMQAGVAYAEGFHLVRELLP